MICTSSCNVQQTLDGMYIFCASGAFHVTMRYTCCLLLVAKMDWSVSCSTNIVAARKHSMFISSVLFLPLLSVICVVLTVYLLSGPLSSQPSTLESTAGPCLSHTFRSQMDETKRDGPGISTQRWWNVERDIAVYFYPAARRLVADGMILPLPHPPVFANLNTEAPQLALDSATFSFPFSFYIAGSMSQCPACGLDTLLANLYTRKRLHQPHLRAYTRRKLTTLKLYKTSTLTKLLRIRNYGDTFWEEIHTRGATNRTPLGQCRSLVQCARP